MVDIPLFVLALHPLILLVNMYLVFIRVLTSFLLSFSFKTQYSNLLVVLEGNALD